MHADLVFVMGWFHTWNTSGANEFRAFPMRLASFTLISDNRAPDFYRVPINQLPTLEQHGAARVINAVCSDRAALCGVSEGGPCASCLRPLT